MNKLRVNWCKEMIRFILLQVLYVLLLANTIDVNNLAYLILLMCAPIEFIGLGYLFKVIR